MNAFTKKLVSILDAKKKNQDGFTLLELLVVVAIMAAVAGTATIALKDTDARASAAAHVSMMDELNKGIRTYRVIKKNELPSRFDSLLNLANEDPGMLGFSVGAPATPFDADAAIVVIPQGVEEIMYAGGITQLQYINQLATGGDAELEATDCNPTNIQKTISSRANAMVAGNIFMSPEANGCGKTVDLMSGVDDVDGNYVHVPHSGVFWTGGSERLVGQPSVDADGNELVEFDGDAATVATGVAYLITGIGPSSSLFNANELGGMTTVPVYRHVKADEYGRFMAVWNVGMWDGEATLSITPGDQAELVAIVDGALDTKEEELGEWDGTRNTI